MGGGPGPWILCPGVPCCPGGCTLALWGRQQLPHQTPVLRNWGLQWGGGFCFGVAGGVSSSGRGGPLSRLSLNERNLGYTGKEKPVLHSPGGAPPTSPPRGPFALTIASLTP